MVGTRDFIGRLSSVLFVTVSLGCSAIDETHDWQPRIGHYSLNDAKQELGDPESCVGLDDGGTACSWRSGKSKDGFNNRLVLTFDQARILSTFNNVDF